MTHIKMQLKVLCKKITLPLFLINEAPCHEDIWGSGVIVPPFSTLALLHAPAALAPGKQLPVPIG
jgi:hypothetical protein